MTRRAKTSRFNPLAWCTQRMTRTTIFSLIAFVVGVTTGTAAHILKWLIATLSGAMTSMLNPGGFNPWLLAIPLAGILLTGIFCRYIIRTPLANGVERLMADIHSDHPDLPPRLTFAPVIASTLTLGMGGSAGSEGPIAYTGAAIGSNIGRICRLDSKALMLMVGCGAGAGIAGIFKAPIGGLLFTLEVLRLPMTTVSVIALLIACITASMTAYALSGCEFDITWFPTDGLDPHILGWMALMGVFCGLYAFYYSAVMKFIAGRLHGISNVWVRNILAGAILAALVALFPVLYGEGYNTVGRIINGDTTSILSYSLWNDNPAGPWTMLIVLAAIIMVKCFATSATNNGGGVAGDFAPTLFAGCIAGLFFAQAANILFAADLDTATFALVGMAAVMAGAIRAPLMAIFLVTEMVDAYTLFLPIVMASAISFAIVKCLTPGDFFTIRHLRRADSR